MIEKYTSFFSISEKRYPMIVSRFTCNRFGIAEFFCDIFKEINHYFPDSPYSVLDVGSGVGPLSLFFAFMGCKVDCVEINPIAVQCLKENIIHHGVQNSVAVFASDFKNIKIEKKYDVVVSNPPIHICENYSLRKKTIQDLQLGILHDTTFSFLTNYWHDESGVGLLDHVLLRARELLNPGGLIAISCVDYDGAINVAERAFRKSSLEMIKSISKEISQKSVGLSQDPDATILASAFLLKSVMT